MRDNICHSLGLVGHCRLNHNQVGNLCVTFCKKRKLFGWLYFYLKWYCSVWSMSIPQHGNRILFSILSSFFKLTFFTTRSMVYGTTTKLYTGVYGLILTELRQLQEKNPPPLNVNKNKFIVVIRKVTILAIKTQNIFNVWCLHNNMYLYNDFLANLKIGIHLFICSGCT